MDDMDMSCDGCPHGGICYLPCNGARGEHDGGVVGVLELGEGERTGGGSEDDTDGRTGDWEQWF